MPRSRASRGIRASAAVSSPLRPGQARHLRVDFGFYPRHAAHHHLSRPAAMETRNPGCGAFFFIQDDGTPTRAPRWRDAARRLDAPTVACDAPVVGQFLGCVLTWACYVLAL